MPDEYVADALARFRATADAAVERGRRVADEARAAGAAFQRECDALAADQRESEALVADHGGYGADHGGYGADAEPPDLRAAQGLPTPADPPKETPRRAADDEDFSQFRIMRPL